MNQMVPVPSPRGRRVTSGGRRVDKDFECGIHMLTYKAARPGCPVCLLEREVKELRTALQEVRNQLERTHDQNVRLESENNFIFAIKEAAEVLDEDDMAFLKTVLYEWRDTKGLGLKTTHGKNRRANGFIVMPRNGEPWAHTCHSIGGMAIADYFDEATNSVGSAKAMEHMVRGFAAHLPGAVR